MTTGIDELIRALREKGALLDEMYQLLEEEQNCIIALDMARLETNQSEVDSAMGRLERLNGNCRNLLAKTGAALGLEDNGSLSPLIARTAGQERLALQGLQTDLTTSTTAVDNLLAMNRNLLQDSLGLVDRSLNFFNSLFNNPTTYGQAGTMRTNNGGARLVCKEI
ncbi:flagellar biogenesis chaperone FlgN [Geotalea daltonii FRC-32]|uniref:Flagellar biogenesis chaperone FlgN n=1 Tax=Geotalea daltonii (strain DSM 22248 / JCM 15807 / FRC-32) TaxID=316067 RepID=B9M0G2_GEODF|nr:flagellar protein FlgN [Geotalea daltonii]ACM18999.1 flagellar biogenesis chaperone FlgN [Geotalea daltonii FRC-32]